MLCVPVFHGGVHFGGVFFWLLLDSDTRTWIWDLHGDDLWLVLLFDSFDLFLGVWMDWGLSQWGV